MKILFDTDIGSDIDDALALLLLLRIPDVELIGLTTVYGCTDIRAKVAKKILDAAGCAVPVVAGQETPFESPMPVWHAGTEGDGVLTDCERSAPLESMGISRGASDFIVEAIEEHGSDLTVVSLGALTNIAAALRRQPAIKTRMAHLFFMGGGITYQQPVPAQLEPGRRYVADASHNVRCDVTASCEVFSSGIPMTVLTNDVTTRIWWDGPPVQELISATDPPDARVVGKLLKVWLDYRTAIFRRRVMGTCPHDPLTVAEATQSSFATYTRGLMTIHGDATSSFVVDKRGPHSASVDIEKDRFLAWFSHMLSSKDAEQEDAGGTWQRA